MIDAARPAVRYIDSNRDELVDSTKQLLGYDTQNPPGATLEAANWLESELEALDYECERFAIDPQKPNFVATIPGEDPYTLLFNGHLDTVPFLAEQWTHDPLGEAVGDRLYGRGATDMKGAIGAMLEVARAYAHTDTTPPVTVQFAFVSDEEVAADAGLAAQLKYDRLKPDACVVGESTGRAGANSIAIGDRGYIWPTIKVTGTAAHGSRPMFGINAIDRLYRIVDSCRTRVQSLGVPTDGFDADIIDESVAYYAHQLDQEVATALFSAPTVNLSRFTGGEAVNSVPATAEATLDIRILPSMKPETVVGTIRETLAEHDGAEITDLTWTEGTYTEPDTPLVRASYRVASAVLDTPVYRRFATGGGDAQTFRESGIPTIEFATGTGTAHATDEFTTGEKLSQNATAYAQIPFELAAERGGADEDAG